MADLAPGGCSCQGACDTCDGGVAPSGDPMASMRIGDLRLMVDYVAHASAYRRFEAQVLAAELDPIGAAQGHGSGQRRSLPILDQLGDPADGPIPDHPGDLDPFAHQEVLFDRGPREIDEPRVTEETFPQLDALGLEALAVPKGGIPFLSRPLPGDPATPELGGIAEVSLDLTCPKPERTSDETAIAATFEVAAPAPLEPHRVFVPHGTPQRNLIVLLHGAGGSAQRPYVDTLATHFARAGFRTVALSWNIAPWGTARLQCLFDLGFEADPSQNTDRTDWADALPQDDADLNECLVEQRASKAHDPTYGVVYLLMEVLVAMLQLDPAGDWGQFLTYGFLPETPERPFAPDWSRIVQAGYSEGANQTAYMLRNNPLFGAILISGGGDLGVIDTTRYSEVPVADWMSPDLPLNHNLVGLWDIGEPSASELQPGWNRLGMPEATVDATVRGPYYDAYGGASRLENDCSCGGGEQAHQSTVGDDLDAAHMYLACKAGT